MALSITRLALVAAGAGALWYTHKKLSGDFEQLAAAPSQPPGQAQSPARAAAAIPEPPTPPAQPPAEEPAIETTAFQEPPIEPIAPAGPAAEEPPAGAFEDAHQEGWHDEELGTEPSAVDELESDPATAADAELDQALEDDGELPEPVADPTLAGDRGKPAHVTRVVDDLLEGRRDDAEDERIEDATLVEEDPDQRST